jgi:hypothetical protein
MKSAGGQSPDITAKVAAAIAVGLTQGSSRPPGERRAHAVLKVALHPVAMRYAAGNGVIAIDPAGSRPVRRRLKLGSRRIGAAIPRTCGQKRSRRITARTSDIP